LCYSIKKQFDGKLSSLVDLDSAMLAFGLIGFGFISFGMVVTIAFQVTWIRRGSVIFIYQKPGNAALYFGEESLGKSES
jgi:hypothetical protein